MDIKKIRNMRDRHRLLLSFGLVTALLALTWALIPLTFETNDDAFIMSCLSGGRTGKPETSTLFSLFFWGKILSSLYTLNSGIPWYTLVFLILVASSLIAICYCVVLSFPKWGWSLFCLLYFCMFLYYSAVLQYTVVSAYCGVAAVALLVTDKIDEDRKHTIIKNIMIFAFAFFSVNIRGTVGYLLLGNAAFAVCLEVFRYMIRSADRQKIKRMILSFFMICAVVVISRTANNIHRSTGGWEDFQEYKSERVKFTDYSKVDYESNKDLFDKIGWSENFYELVKRWFFMDESVNAETLRQINERSVRGPIRVGRSLLHDWFPKIELQVKVWVLLLVFLLADAIIHHERRWRRNIVSFLWLAVWFVETQYFGYTGRIAERAFEAWTLFAVIPSVLGSAGECQVMEEEVKSVTGNIAIPVLALAFCIVCVRHPSGGYLNAKSFALAKSEVKITHAYIEDYAAENPGNIYITGISLPREGGPWRVYKKGLPYNLFFWGGSSCYSPIYYAQLKRNGLEHLFMEDFFAENVYFIAREEPDEYLLKVMEEKFPGCTYTITEEKDRFVVYQFQNDGLSAANNEL